MELAKKSLWAVLVVLVATAAFAQDDQEKIDAALRDHASLVKSYALSEAMPAILKHGREIASFGSRQTGEPACNRAAEYIRDELAKAGLEGVTLQAAPVTAPVSGGASVTLPDGRVLKAYPLVPNGVQPSSTPAEGLSGPLVRVGRGDLGDVGGKNLSGAILLMDYNSGDNWLKLMEFGAAAAIFVEPDFTTWRETDGKYIDLVPLKFPRVWVDKAEGAELMKAAEGEPRVTLRSRMSLENVDAPWVEGYLPGAAKIRATIVVVTHFDARSIVPSMAPGGDEVWGTAAFIELARYFKLHRPPVNLRFVAFSGNWQTQALSRLYVSRTLERIGVEDRLICGIDLSTDDDGLAVDYNGWIGDTGSPRFTELKPLFFGTEGTTAAGLVGEIDRFYGKGFNFYGGLQPLPHESDFALSDMAHKRPLTRAPRFYTPNESWESAKAVAVVFQTAKVWRYLHNTPLETFDKSVARADNLKPQVAMLFYVLDRLAEIVRSEKSLPPVKADIWAASETSDKGYSDVKGQVRVFSVKTAWYDTALPRDAEGNPLGDTYLYVFPYNYEFMPGKNFAFLPWPLLPQRYFHEGLQSFMCRYIVKVGADGRFFIPDMAVPNAQTVVTFLAYTLDKEGNVIYATDYGLRGDVEFNITDMKFFTAHMEVPVTIFPCGSMTLFSLDDLVKFAYQDNVPDEWVIKFLPTGGDGNANEWAQVPYMKVARVMRAGARTEAEEYSFVQWKNTAMVFLKPDMPAEILMQSVSAVKRLVLNNAAAATLNPPGYTVRRGENLPLFFTPAALLRQLNYLDAARLAAYDKYGVRSYEAEKEHRIASAYLDIAASAVGENDYARAATSAALGLEAEGRAYAATLRLLWDVVSTTVFYFTLLIPFSFLTERLLVPQSTPSRTLIVSSTIFVVFVGLLWVFHPGFKLADNIWITIISFLIVILTLPAVFLIVGRGLKMIKESGEKYYRSHVSDIERLGVLVAALSLAISNMRRRRLRTGLTLATITLLILALVLLTTSTSFNYTFNQPREHIKTNMEGILVSNTYDRRKGMFEDVYEILRRLYSREAYVVPREYYNYAYADTAASKRKLFLTAGEYSVVIPSIQVLDENEPKVTGIDKAITSGRWFNASDVFAVILSDRIAAGLHVKPGDKVIYEDLPLEVVGVFDNAYVDKNCLDPDGKQVTPLYFADPSQGDLENPGHFPSADICYLPRRLNDKTHLLTTATWGVVIKPFDRGRITAIADSIALEVANVDVFKSLEGKVTVLSAYHKVSIKGSAFMIMPLAVAFFMVLAVMLGTVHERRREINIFSSVGLSPRHVAGMFLVESIVYAGIASVFGYFMGIIMLHIFRVEGLFPPVFYPNYLGIFVIYSVGLAMLATISSSVYPMYIASKIANPSLERTWRIATKPVDGRWRIEFPFIASDIYEALGIMAFLREFVEHFSGEGMGVFASLSPCRLAKLGDDRLTLRFSSWLAPFERNITQTVSLDGTMDPVKKRWSFAFDIEYTSGPTYLWLKSNKLFVDAFRKQMLIWRGFSDKMIEEYAYKGQEAIVEGGPARPEGSVGPG